MHLSRMRVQYTGYLPVRNVRDALKFVIMCLDLFTIEKVNDPKVLENALFAYKKSKGISGVTYNSYLKNLNTYFIWLEKHEYITVNKLKKVTHCTEPINEQYTLSEDFVDQIVGHVYVRRQTKLQRLRNVFFIHLLRFTGARPCELLSLRYQDIKVISGKYKLTISGRKQKGRLRYYFLDAVVSEAFQAYADYRNSLRSNEYMLFISTSKIGGWTEKGMRGLFKRLSNELSFRVTAYAFRRYVATRLNARGVDMKDIRNYMGHTRDSTTIKYIERSCILTARGSEAMSSF